MPIGPRSVSNTGTRVAGREPVGLERDAEVELAVGADEPIGRDDVRRVVDRVGAGVAGLLEPVDHMDAVRRGHVDARPDTTGPSATSAWLAVPRARLMGVGTVGALAPRVERELGEDHEVAATRRGLGDEAVHLLERRGLVARHRLEVHAADGDRTSDREPDHRGACTRCSHTGDVRARGRYAAPSHSTVIPESRFIVTSIASGLSSTNTKLRPSWCGGSTRGAAAREEVEHPVTRPRGRLDHSPQDPCGFWVG